MDYNVVSQDALGKGDQLLQGLLEIQAARSFNTVGSATLTLSDRYYKPSSWVPNQRFKIYRRATEGSFTQLGNTVWFLKQPTWHYSSKTWELKLEDTLSLLNNPLVAYTSDTLYADKTYDNGNQAEADDILKAYVRENLGALALAPERNLAPYLTVEDNTHQGPVVEKTASYQELLSVLTSVCQDAEGLGTPIYFDVVPSSGETFVFRTFLNYLGHDKARGAGAASFGTPWNNLTDIEITWDYSQLATVAYVGGVGDGAGRLIVEVDDLAAISRSPFSRIERFVDMKDEDRTSVLEAAGRAFLAKSATKAILTGKVVDTPRLTFGRDFDYGDQVRAVVGTFEFVSTINAFSTHWTGGKEELDLRLKGESL